MLGCLDYCVHTFFRADTAYIAHIRAVRQLRLKSFKAHNVSNHVYSLGCISLPNKNRLHEFRRSYKSVNSLRKTSAHSRRPVAHGVTGTLRPLSRTVAYYAPPLLSVKASVT